MLKSQSARVVAVGVAVLLFVLLLFVPRVPSKEAKEDPSKSGAVSAQVADAKKLMQAGQPMQGILKLVDILDANPDNTEVLWILGEASMQTGQFEKAVTRFEHLIEVDKTGSYPVAQLYLGEAYAQLDQKEQAIKSFNRFLESGGNEELMQGARARIADLEK